MALYLDLKRGTTVKMNNSEIEVDQVQEEISEIEVHQVNDMSYNMEEISEAERICGNVVISIKKMMKELPPHNFECSIHRVPKLLREMNKTMYTPQVISIGPFHHRSQKNLIAEEQYKLRSCITFLYHLESEMKSLEFLVKATQIWVEEARNYYAEQIELSDEDFIKMMLVDGCFLVELLIQNYKQHYPDSFAQIHSSLDLSLCKRIHQIYIDLIKLENQLPFFVLERLFHFIPQNNGDPISFIQLAVTFLQRGLVRTYYPFGSLYSTPKHLLDCLSFYFVDYVSLFFAEPLMASEEISDDMVFITPPSISELCDAGVTMKKLENSNSLMNLGFRKGIFTIPPLIIDDFFEAIVRNLMAFEHFSSENESKCIPYITFLDYLISTEKDVNILVKAGIIVNNIGGSDKEVSKLFNNLCKFVEQPSDGRFNDISNALSEHCNKSWNKRKATLKHDYFCTPWASISVFGAILLLFLTLLQTIFSCISTLQK